MAEQSYLNRIRFNPSLLKGPVASYLKNFRLTILLLLSIVFLGLVAFINLPRRLNPEVKIPIVTVVTVLPGAGPEDIESLVTIPIENQLQSLEGIDTLSSLSRDNVSAITLQFTSNVDSDKAKDDVQSAVDSVQNLPEDATSPSVMALDFENQPIWEFALTSTEDIGSLQRYAKLLKKKLEDDPKIDNVVVRGLEEQEIVVEIDPEKISQYGINPLQISSLLRASANAYPAGTVDSLRNVFALTINPSVETVEDIRNLRVNLQGNSVTLGSIATVEERSKPNQTSAYYATKETPPTRVVTFSVYKTIKSTITDGAKAAEKIVHTEIESSDGRFVIQTLSNTAEEISEQFTGLLGEFRTTILLVVACLFIFLGLRQALISSLTVPLTFLSAFAMMQVLGMSINFLSLFAFLLALGLLVDDTIVVISAMTTYYRTGKFTPYETGLLVWKDTIIPIWSTTITTIWSFIPLLLASGIIGEFIKPIPVVVTVTMISSTAIAVLITLPIMILILKPVVPKRVLVLGKIIVLIAVLAGLVASFGTNPLFIPILILFVMFAIVSWRIRPVLNTKIGELRSNKIISYLQKSSDQGIISVGGLAESYKRLMRRVLASSSARKKVVIAIVVYALVGFMLVPAGLVKNEFFPKTDGERIFIQLEMPSGTTTQRVQEETLHLFEELRQNEYADFLTAAVGAGAPNDFSGGGDSANSGLITIHLPPAEKRSVTSIDIAETLRKEYSQYSRAKISVVELSGGPPAGSDLQMELSGSDLAVLDTYANRLQDYLNEQNGVTNVTKSIKPGTSALTFVPNLDKISQAGLTLDSIGLWTRLYGSGFTLDELKLEKDTTEETPVRFTFSKENPSPESLGRLAIQTPQGSVPLLSLGTLELKPNPTLITRKNGNRTITVSAGVRTGFSIQDINKKFEEHADTLDLPSGYAWQTGGVNEENTKSIQSILQAMGVATLLILVTMVLQFQSFRQAIIVLIVIPLAVSSVFYSFAITNTPLSFPAIIGILSLFGIVVTNSMFIVDKINLNIKEGMSFEESIADAGASRMEPIILTKLSTVLGLLPITLADPLWRGLGGAIISGLLLASIIMLFFIPVLYFDWFKNSQKKVTLS